MFLPHKALQDLAPLLFIYRDMKFDYCYTVLKLQAKTAEPITHTTIIGIVWGASEIWQLEGYRRQLGFAGRMMLYSLRPGSSAFYHPLPQM